MKLLFSLLIMVPAVSFADLDKCISADKVSREFTLAAANGAENEAWKLINPNSPLGKKDKFNDEVKRQFAPLLGKRISLSISNKGLENASCHEDPDKVIKFKDHRILIYMNQKLGNRVAEILPVSVEVHFIKGKGWLVSNFASTAL